MKEEFIYLTGLPMKDIVKKVANLTGATMLGVERSLLVGRHFSDYIARDDQDTFYLHNKRFLETGEFVLQTHCPGYLKCKAGDLSNGWSMAICL